MDQFINFDYFDPEIENELCKNRLNIKNNLENYIDYDHPLCFDIEMDFEMDLPEKDRIFNKKFDVNLSVLKNKNNKK